MIRYTPKEGTQCARILDALADGQWKSVAAIHRRAGYSRLNSRVSDLRRYGYGIEHRYQPRGRRATLDHAYRLLDAPGRPENGKQNLSTDEDAPRDEEGRYRVYAVSEYDEKRLVATCPDEESVGVAICTLGREGQFERSCVGVLDTHADSDKPGTWILNPWDTRTF